MTLLYSTSPCTLKINRVVQDDLNRVAQWMESNKLILNQSKTKSMLFGSRQNLAKSPNFCIQLHGKVLERVAKFSYLGVVLDETLSWKDHVEYVSNKVSSRLGLLTRIRSCLTLARLRAVSLLLEDPRGKVAEHESRANGEAASSARGGRRAKRKTAMVSYNDCEARHSGDGVILLVDDDAHLSAIFISDM